MALVATAGLQRAIAGVSLLVVLRGSVPAAAAEPTVSDKRHYVGGAVLGQYVFTPGEGEENESLGAGLALTYAYRVTPPVELGLELAYVHVRENDPDLFLPSVTARFSKPLNARLELGLTLRLGLSYQKFHDTDFPDRWRHALGATVGLSPDLRLRLGEGLSMQVSPDFDFGTKLYAHATESMEAPWQHYMAAGLRLGLLLGL